MEINTDAMLDRIRSIEEKIEKGIVLKAPAISEKTTSEETKKATIIEAKKNLDKVGASVIGVILTKVKFKKNANYYRYDAEKVK